MHEQANHHSSGPVRLPPPPGALILAVTNVVVIVVVIVVQEAVVIDLLAVDLSHRLAAAEATIPLAKTTVVSATTKDETETALEAQTIGTVK